MFGISFLELALIIALSFLFLTPKEAISYISKFILFIETLKEKIEDIKNEIFLKEIEDEMNDIGIDFTETKAQTTKDSIQYTDETMPFSSPQNKDINIQL